jgi:hypothetical protein
MKLDASLKSQLKAMARSLDSVGAANAFPRPRALSDALVELIPEGDSTQRNIDQNRAASFITAAVDIWLRGVHSFLVSASLTEASPIWASVSGYYSSHYAVRGIAHLLGYFHLFHGKHLVEVKLENGRYVCSFTKKAGGDGEHKLYWKLVKKSNAFAEDIVFNENKADKDKDESDIRHRNHANYVDHVGSCPTFKAISEQEVRERITFISKIAFDAPPLPRLSEFPDVENVQVIAYHRLVKFRRMVDETVGPQNKFWRVHRSPSFAKDLVDFQLVEGGAFTG